MNDSISVSSSSFSNNSSNNSKSNSLNRSEVQYARLEAFDSSTSKYTDNSDPNNNNSSLMANLNRTTIGSTSDNDKAKRRTGTNDNSLKVIDNYFMSPRKQSLPLSANRRRAKSQILFNGDSLNTLADQNTLLMEDLYSLKKQLKKKDATIIELNEIRDRLESEMHELSASLFEVILVSLKWNLILNFEIQIDQVKDLLLNRLYSTHQENIGVLAKIKKKKFIFVRPICV